jgi:hypothetical protein
VSETTHGNCTPGSDLLACFYLLAREAGIVEERDLPYHPQITCFPKLTDLSGKATYKFSNANIVALYLEGDIIDLIKNEANGISDIRAQQLSDKVANIRRVLSQYGYPLAIDVPIFMTPEGRFANNWEDGPDIEMPQAIYLSKWLQITGGSVAGDGWHAIAICGYDDATQRFTFKNSWRDWGNRGFGTIPYDYVAKYTRSQVAGWV